MNEEIWRRELITRAQWTTFHLFIWRFSLIGDEKILQASPVRNWGTQVGDRVPTVDELTVGGVWCQAGGHVWGVPEAGTRYQKDKLGSCVHSHWGWKVKKVSWGVEDGITLSPESCKRIQVQKKTEVQEEVAGAYAWACRKGGFRKWQIFKFLFDD